MMPRLDGYELTQRLRGEKATRNLPIILLTARVQQTDIARGIEAGADGYVAKPFSTHDLRERVHAVLGR
jgi:DNA-binding response OmpR family regulator